MTKEHQRSAFAEALGWTEVCKNEIYANEPTGLPPRYAGKPGGTVMRCAIPNIDDLNIIHEAVESLRGNQFHYVDYPHQLFKVVSGMDWTGDVGYFFFCLVNATAAQRREAFLKTVGKWVE